MKKRLFAGLLVLILALALCAPALAYGDYDLSYDATDKLDTVFLMEYNKALEQLSDQYSAELRVDIVTDTEGYTLNEYAAKFHEDFSYGYPGTGDGVLLMILASVGDYGLAVEDYAVISYGENSSLDGAAQYLADNASLTAVLAPENWAGDLASDCNAMMNLLSNYQIGMAAFLPEAADGAGGSGWQNGEAGLSCVTDWAGLLSDSERESLESNAASVSSAYGCGVYIVTVQDYTEYSSASVREAAEDIYRDNSLGAGSEKSGVMLLLSMADRDYSIIANGYGNQVFTDRGKTWVEENFLDNFRYDDWYGGFYDYINYSAQLLEEVKSGVSEPGGDYSGDYTGDYESGWTPMERFMFHVEENLAIILGAPAVIALIVCLVMRLGMRSVKKGGSAREYVTAEGLDLRVREDRFTHTTESRVRVKSESSGHGGGGTSIGSSGFSGHSGKF